MNNGLREQKVAEATATAEMTATLADVTVANDCNDQLKKDKAELQRRLDAECVKEHAHPAGTESHSGSQFSGPSKNWSGDVNANKGLVHHCHDGSGNELCGAPFPWHEATCDMCWLAVPDDRTPCEECGMANPYHIRGCPNGPASKTFASMPSGRNTATGFTSATRISRAD